MTDMRGKFVWYELMTSDMAAAESFYCDVVGWTAKDSGMPGMAYTLFSVDDAMIGGLMTVPEEAVKMGARPSWIGYVAVADVDAEAQRVTALGGQVYRAPDDIPGVGRFAIVADPQGAVLSLFRGARDEPPPPLPPFGAPGIVNWHELHAADWEKAFAYYAELFGWTKSEAIDMGPMGTYQLYASGELTLGGMMNKQPQAPMPYWMYYVNVDDIDAAAARVTEKGGMVAFGPSQVPGGSWIVQGFDPQGALFGLVGPKH
jgi:predicted enzyme related to lactoylglutathione lyase